MNAYRIIRTPALLNTRLISSSKQDRPTKASSMVAVHFSRVKRNTARVLTLLNETANDAADVGPDEVDNVVAVGSVPAGPDVAYRALVVRLWPALLAL